MAVIPALVGVYLVMVALMVGSFVNLAADRLPRGESIVRPRSHCRACGRQLNLIDLLPVAGYLLRNGRCATCRMPIGIRSPLVETAMGACMAVPLLRFGIWPGAVIGLSLIGVLGLVVVGLSLRRQVQSEASF